MSNNFSQDSLTFLYTMLILVYSFIIKSKPKAGYFITIFYYRTNHIKFPLFYHMVIDTTK